MKACLKYFLLIAVAMLVSVIGNNAKAAGTTNIWDGSASTNWHTAANWSANTVPTNSHNITIPTGLTNYPVLSSNGVCRTLIAIGDAASISGTGTLTISNAATLTATGTSTISCPLAANVTTTISTTNTSDNLTISGVVSGTGGLNKSGTGNLTLSGINTYDGVTTINTGTIRLGADGTDIDGPLGSSVGGTTIANGAALDLNGHSLTTTGVITLRGTGPPGGLGGALVNTAGNAVFTGGIALSAAGAIATTPAGSITISGNVTGTSALTLTGNGIGTLSGIRSGTGSIIKDGNGIWTLSGANSYSGVTTINLGILKLGANGGGINTPLGTTISGTTIASGGTLDLNGFTLGTAEAITSIAGTGYLNGGALTNTGTNASYSGAITLITPGATITATSSGTLGLSGGITGGFPLTLEGEGTGTFSGIRSGSGALIKQGTGTWTLSGLNSYFGTTTVTEGYLRAENNSVVASISGPFGLNASGLILNGGTIQSNVATFSRPITVTATNSGLDAYGTARTISSQVNNGTGSTFNLNIGGTTAASAEGQDLTLSGVISNSSGTLSITKIGTSKAIITATNTFTGGATLNAGTLNIDDNQALGTAAGTFTIAGGTIDSSTPGITTVSYPLALNANFTFTGTNSLNLGAGAISMNTDRQITTSANTLTLGGTLSAATRTLTKAGAGTLSFGGNPVTLNGLTISEGILTSTSVALNLAGNFTNNSTFNNNAGTVNFNGTSPQSILGSVSSTFNNFGLSNSTGLILGLDATVNGTLAFTAGKISTGINKLILGNAATVTGAGTGKYIYGTLRRNIPATLNVSVPFDIGGASTYTPVQLDFSGTPGGTGSIDASSAATQPPPESGISQEKYVNRSWTLTNNSVTGFSSYSPTFTFTAGDIVGGALPANFIISKNTAGTWTLPTTGTKTSTSTQASGLTTFGSFAIGEELAATRLVISGSNSQTAGTTQNITITAKDNNNNTILAYTGDKSLTFSGANSSSNPVTAPIIKDKTGSAINFGTATTITFTNGVASVSAGNNGVMALYKAETALISVTDGNISALDLDRLSVTTTSSAPTKLTIVSLDPLTPINGLDNTQLTLGVIDIYGNTANVTQNTSGTLSSNYTLVQMDSELETALEISPPVFTINSGQNQVEVNLLKFKQSTLQPDDTYIADATITATVTSGDILSAATTPAFKIVDGVVYRPKLDGGGKLSNGSTTGYWSAIVWEYSSDGRTTWTDAASAPIALTELDLVEISPGVTLISDQNVSIYNLWVILGGTLEVATGTTATLKYSPDHIIEDGVHIYGTVVNAGGTLINESPDHPVHFDGGKYIHAINGGRIPPAIWAVRDGNIAKATITGITSTAITSGLDQNFMDLEWNNASQTVSQSLHGNTTISGTLTLSNGNLAVGANTLTLAGPTISGNPSNLVTTSSSSLSFSGTSAGINLPNSVTELNNLTINNSNGISLNSSPVVNGVLTLTSGNITTGANTLAIAATGSVVRTSGHVNGNLKKNFDTGELAASTFSVGTASAYTPVTVDIDGVGGTLGNLTVSTTGASHPQIATSDLQTDKDINRYWTISPDGTLALGSRTYKLNLGFLEADAGSANTSNFVIRRYNMGWFAPIGGSYTRTGASTEYSSFSAFSDFAVGEASTATRLVITGSATQTAGISQNLTITAKDANGNTAYSYTGDKILTFSGANSSSSPATTPAVVDKAGSAISFGAETTITFTNGVATVTGGNNGAMTLYNAELATISATDGIIGSSAGDRLSVSVSAAVFNKLAVSLSTPQNSSIAFTGTNTLTAQDAFGNTLSSFDASANNITLSTSLTGTISGLSGTNKLNNASDFSSGIANLTSLGLTFTGTAGTGTFTFTPGSGSPVTSGNVVMNGGNATKLIITGTGTQTAGDNQNLTITAKDANGNTAYLYTGDKNLTFSGANPTTDPERTPTIHDKNGLAVNFGTPATISFTNGVSTVTTGRNGILTLYKVETATISATDGSISAAESDRLTVLVSPGIFDKLMVSLSLTQTSSIPFGGANTLTAQDHYGNTRTDFDASGNNVTVTHDHTGVISGLSGGNILNSAADFSNGIANLTSLGMTYTGDAGKVVFTFTTATGIEAVSDSIEVGLGTIRPTPAFSPAAGAIVFPSEITITSTDADNIYYTIDGTDPGTSVGGSTLLYNPLSKPVVNTAQTIKAIAVKIGFTNSEIGTADYFQATSADLSSIILSGSPTNYNFIHDTYTYDGVGVAYATSSITVTPIGSGVITVDGTTVSSGATSNPISLTSGVEKAIAVVSTETGKKPRTYNINVTRALNPDKMITSFSILGSTGTINEAAKTIAVTVPCGTDPTALVATFTTTGASVKVGATTQVSGSTANDFTNPLTYTVTAADASTQNYTVTVTIALDASKAITAYSILGVDGTINEGAKTISVTVPFGTDPSNLIANFSTTGISVKVGETVQTSGTTANNFSSPVTYTVTAEDASTQNYVVTVTVALNPAKAITAFSILGNSGTINEGAKTIAVTVPYGTDVTALVAAFTTSGASVKVGATTQVSETTPNNFTSPVTYTVTAADATTQDYVVTVTVALNPAKAITAFSILGNSGTINEGAKTIAVTVPYGTDVTALVATFTTTGASVKVGATTQVSGTTPNNFTSPVTYTVTAADASTQDYTVTVTPALNPAKAITAFSILGTSGTINEGAKTIAVTVPYGTDVTALVASFTTTGASVKVGATTQVSGTTPNNFTSPVIYTVTAEDATTQDYTVTVTVALNPAKAITAFSILGTSGTINEGAKTIAVTVPYGTDVTALVASFTTTGASVKVGATTQVSNTTPNNFTSPVTYTVTAADATTQDYTVTVTVALNPAKAITAFSISGNSGTINEGAKTVAVTVPYGTDVTALVATFTTTGASVKVGATTQVSNTTPNNFTSPVTYTVTAADATTQDYTVTVTVALNPAKAITAFSILGNGTINEGAKTIAVSVPYGTDVTALVATFTTTGASVKVGATTQVSNTTPNNFTSPVTYTVTAADATTQEYVVSVTVALNPAKAITAFSLDGNAGTINEGAKTIVVSVPYGTDVTALVATFTTTGASVKVGSTTQVSNTTPNNFSSPVTYTVTAADASTQDYTVSVNVAANPAKAITAFSILGNNGTINEGAKTIAVTVPYGTNVTALVASFTITGASVKVGATTQVSGTTPNNFTSPVTYTVTAADATTQDYTVTVTVALNPAKAITAFSISGNNGTINESAKTIAVTVPFGTDVTVLVATFTTTGASVKVGTTTQISNTTPNNFTSPVTYTVTAADATTQDYIVTVTVAANTSKAITAFTILGNGTVNEGAKTIAVTVPYGTDVTSLVATFTTTGASVNIGGTTQTSGSTANNFSSPLTYQVVAADASTQNYVVTVTVALNPAKAFTAFSLNGNAGTINEGAKTIAVNVPFGTDVTALVATFTTTGASVNIGGTPQTSGSTANNFSSPLTYQVVAADASTQNYVVTVTVAPNPAKAITSFSILGNAGTINEGAKTIAVTVPYGTDVTALVATFTTTGASVKVGATTQVSGTTANDFTNPLTFTVTAADATIQDYTVTVTPALNPAKAITAFSILGTSGTINEGAKTIAVTVPYGTDVTALVASFTTTGASVKVGATTQVSATTSNNFSSPVTYTVTAADASTQDYTVTVTAALNPAKAITAFSILGNNGTINEGAKTVAVTVPYGTDVTALVATFTTTGTSVKVGLTTQTNGITPNNFSSPVTYTVTAADASTQNYLVTVTVALNPAKAITAFTILGNGTVNESAKTIAVTVPFGTSLNALVATFTTTGASVKVGSTSQVSGTTPNNFSSPVSYTVTAADASTQDYVVTVSIAANTAKAITAFSILGNTGTIDEGNKTIAVSVPFGTNLTALVASFSTSGSSVTVGAVSQTSGSTANNFSSPLTYTVTAADASTQDYVVTVTTAANTAKALTAFSILGNNATINEVAKTIAITVPYGTNVTSLIASFTTTGALVKVGTTTQTSGSTINNFTSPLTYTVTAADASTQNYVVTVTVAANSAKAITAFSILGISGTINEGAKTIALTLPYNTDLTALVASFTSSGASVKVESITQTSGSTSNNFTSPVTYIVTAADASAQNYVVTVTTAANPAKAITAFSILGTSATINEDAKTISQTVPYGTNLTALVATFTSSGASVKVGTTTQISGTTANDFSSLVTYTVTAADASTQNYVVTVTALANPAKAITAFSISGNTGTINEDAKTIAVTVPYGTNLTALVATFTSNGTSVKVGGITQTSGSTANNFSSTVTYTVTAADATTQDYIVSVNVAANTAKTFSAFSILGSGTINESTKTIAVTVPFGTDLSSLVATFTTSGASVKVGVTTQVSGTTPNNFSSPVTYIVTAEDASTQNYVVTVNVAESTTKAITAFSISGNTGTINEDAGTIDVTVPSGTSLTALVATFTTTGALVKIGASTQISGTTANNFSNPVLYTVTAADGSTQNYTVIVSVAEATTKAITAFTILGNGTVNESTKTIAVTVPFGTDLTSLVATFSITGASLKVGSITQVSGATTNNFSSPVTYTVTAENASAQDYVVTVTAAANPAKTITAFSIMGTSGIINESLKTITVTLPYGTDRSALIATFTTTGASVRIGETTQISGSAINNFNSSLTYTVTAADASTQDYLVTVSLNANPAKEITAFSILGSGTINEIAKTIAVTVPYGTDLTTLVASFNTTGASVKVGTITQLSGSSINNFTTPLTYTVTAADGSTKAYVVTVSQAPSPAKAITAFTILGNGMINESAKTITVTVPFGTNRSALVAKFTTSGASVKVGSVTQTSETTANNFNSPVTYTVIAADGSAQNYVVTVTVSGSSTKAITAFTILGNGIVNESAKTVAVTVPYGTDPGALIATFNTTGASVKVNGLTQTSGTTANDFSSPITYTVTAEDASIQNYVVTVTVAANASKAFTAFSISGVNGAINENAKTITLTLPFGANLSALVATFNTSGTSVRIGSNTQISGTTSNNFNGPLTYTITAANGSSQNYVVTVSVSQNPAKAITAYSILGKVATINETSKAIAVSLPYNSEIEIEDLIATFTSTGATVKVGEITQISGSTSNNFSSPVTYTVIAADASTQNYTVTVSVTDPTFTAGTISDDQMLCDGISVPLVQTIAPAGGSGTYTYQWQKSTSGSSSGFADITGATNIGYDPGNLSQTTWFRRMVNYPGSNSASVPTNVIQITVNPPVSNNLLVQPAVNIFCQSVDPAILIGGTPSGGTGTFSYQWKTAPYGAACTPIPGATSKDYDPGVLTQTTYFRREVTSGNCTYLSDAILITVIPLIENNVISADQTIIFGSAAATLTGLPANGGESIKSYLWESSTVSDITGFGPAAGDNSGQNYNPGVLTQTSYFRRRVSSGICPQVFSNVVKITVSPLNHAPIAFDDTYATSQSNTLVIAGGSGVLSNDTDQDNDQLIANIVSTTTKGTLILQANGGFTYTPVTNFAGTDSFTYRVCDNGNPSLCDIGTVVISVSSNKQLGISKAVSAPILEADGFNSNILTYKITVKNYSNAILNNVQVTDSLAKTFPSPTSFVLQSIPTSAKGLLKINSAFNGYTNINLIEVNNSLGAGQADTIRITLKVKPNNDNMGPFNNIANARATDAANNPVLDTSTKGSDPDPDNSGIPDESVPTDITLIKATVRIPEGFSPNGDGINDTFVIENLDNESISLQVFNALGALVYRNDSYKNEWDGLSNQRNFNGIELPNGTYFYIVSKRNNKENYVSFITIYR